MSAECSTARPESRITVDGGEFYSFIRALKRSYRVAELGFADEDVDGLLGMNTQVGDGERVVFLQFFVERFVVAFAEGNECGFIFGGDNFAQTAAGGLQNKVFRCL